MIFKTQFEDPVIPENITRVVFDYEQFSGDEFTINAIVTDISADGALGKERYILTVKTGGLMAHEEFETDISKEAYERLCAKACGNVITKDRYVLPLEDDLKLELDIFHGAFEGLILGEVEFPSEEKARDYTPPSYIKEDVTMDGRFHNNRMSMMSSEEIEALLSSVHQL